MKILIATHNPAKIKELSKWLMEALPNTEVVTLGEVNITDDPEETGKTFEENAELKARYYAKTSGLPTIADDGGIMIDALGGAPGVKSKRWLGRAASDHELIDFCLKQLKGVPIEKRTARFIVTLCFIDPTTHKKIHETQSVEGTISEKPTTVWQPGFPYRAVFNVTKFGKFYDELADHEHAAINHRRIAIRRLAEKIRNS